MRARAQVLNRSAPLLTRCTPGALLNRRWNYGDIYCLLFNAFWVFQKAGKIGTLSSLVRRKEDINEKEKESLATTAKLGTPAGGNAAGAGGGSVNSDHREALCAHTGHRAPSGPDETAKQRTGVPALRDISEDPTGESLFEHGRQGKWSRRLGLSSHADY